MPVQIFWVSPKIWLHLVLLQKHLCWNKKQFYWMQIICLSGTKCLWLPQCVNKFLVWHNKFGPAQNILELVKGQDVSASRKKLWNFEIPTHFSEMNYALSFYRSQNVLWRSKFFVPDQKFIYTLWQSKRWFAFSKIVSSKNFEEALNSVKFLGWLKKFGQAQNILGPVKGQGIHVL